jgi:type I restriction enzyme M protein
MDVTFRDDQCRIRDEAGTPVTLYGQEKDAATSGLARMNMILHNNPTALIMQGDTLTDPKFKDGDTLKTFNYVVANPPFSDKRWSTGLDPLNDPYQRFQTFGTPPAKQGDYAYLLHIVRSLKSTGKGACILPHGVLFRGGAEADIRRALVRKGYIKGIIGLPPNLFFPHRVPVGSPSRASPVDDRRKRQTFAATPAEPGDLPWGDRGRSSPPGRRPWP